VASSFRAGHTSTSTVAARFLSARNFSDSSASDDDIKVGTVKFFYQKQHFGFIIPDGMDENSEELIFVHKNDIKQPTNTGERFFPSLQTGQRVQFKVGPPEEGKKGGKALEVTSEGGDLIPPFNPGYLRNYTRIQKARFGDEVFDIISTAQNQEEMETKIVEAFDRVKHNIERQQAKIQRATELGLMKDDGKEKKDEEEQE
jgi:cold shock CspA family protein